MLTEPTIFSLLWPKISNQFTGHSENHPVNRTWSKNRPVNRARARTELPCGNG